MRQCNYSKPGKNNTKETKGPITYEINKVSYLEFKSTSENLPMIFTILTDLKTKIILFPNTYTKATVKVALGQKLLVN